MAQHPQRGWEIPQKKPEKCHKNAREMPHKLPFGHTLLTRAPIPQKRHRNAIKRPEKCHRNAREGPQKDHRNTIGIANWVYIIGNTEVREKPQKCKKEPQKCEQSHRMREVDGMTPIILTEGPRASKNP